MNKGNRIVLPQILADKWQKIEKPTFYWLSYHVDVKHQSAFRITVAWLWRANQIFSSQEWREDEIIVQNSNFDKMTDIVIIDTLVQNRHIYLSKDYYAYFQWDISTKYNLKQYAEIIPSLHIQ